MGSHGNCGWVGEWSVSFGETFFCSPSPSQMSILKRRVSSGQGRASVPTQRRAKFQTSVSSSPQMAELWTQSVLIMWSLSCNIPETVRTPKPAVSKPCWAPCHPTKGCGKGYRRTLAGHGFPFQLQHPSCLQALKPVCSSVKCMPEKKSNFQGVLLRVLQLPGESLTVFLPDTQACVF